MIVSLVSNDLVYDQRMIRICSSLQDAGFSVRLLGRKLSNSEALNEMPFAQERITCWFETGKLFYIEFNIRLFFWLMRHDWDIVNAVDLDTILPGLICSKIRAKRLTYDAHEYYTETPEVVRRPLVQWVWKKVAKFCIPRADSVYTVSQSIADIFKEKYQTTVSVVRNMPKKGTQDCTQKRAEVILYQGALNEGRGLEQIIAAMPYIDKAELYLIGEGDLSESLRKQAQQSEVAHRIHFKGFMQPEELRRISPSVKLGLNLLEHKGESYYFSLANKFFDYVQAGTPSVNMNFPEYRSMMELHEVGVLVDDLNPKTLAHTINTLLNNAPLWDQMHQACLLAAEEWIWEKESENLFQHYKL